MAQYSHLPIFVRTYEFVKLVYRFVQQFRKEYKYSLGQDMKRDSLCLIRSIYRANKEFEKIEHLKNFQDDFEILNSYERNLHVTLVCR